MNQDYSAKDLHRYIMGEIPAMGTPKTEWRITLERRMHEDEQKPRPIVTQPQIEKRRVRSKDGVSRAFTGAPCTACGRPLRNDAVGTIHERCARKREHCDCGGVLKINWPHPVCGGCIRAAQRETTLVGKRICAEPGCGRILNKNNTLPKCLKHAAKLRAAMNTKRKREKRAEMRLAA